MDKQDCEPAESFEPHGPCRPFSEAQRPAETDQTESRLKQNSFPHVLSAALVASALFFGPPTQAAERKDLPSPAGLGGLKLPPGYPAGLGSPTPAPTAGPTPQSPAVPAPAGMQPTVPGTAAMPFPVPAGVQPAVPAAGAPAAPEPPGGEAAVRPEGPPGAKPEAPSRPPAEPAEEGDLSPIEQAVAAQVRPVEMGKPQAFTPRRLRQFGYNFFQPQAQGFAPLTDVPVPPDYVIGPGDHVVVSVWGSIEGTYDLEVDRNGEILLPRVGTLRVWGMPYSRLQEAVRSQLAKVFKDFQLNVNLGKLRLIRVYVVGEVRSPGGYDVSSLATVIPALAAAGGPLKTGSLRSIELKRDGKLVEAVDLYDFLLRGDKSKDARLLPGDTVFVPVVGRVAGIDGNVKRPAIYEVRRDDTLRELLALADGIIPTGYLQRLQISRVEAHERKVVSDFDLDPRSSRQTLEQRTSAVPLRDMDVVRVFSIDQTLRGYVRLEGHVLRPGDYALKLGMRVSDLLPPDNLLPEYYTSAGQVTRLFPPDLHPEVIYFDPSRALAGDPADNLLLQEFDTVRLFSRWEMEEQPKAKVSGEILKPGEYRLTDGMTVRDLVLQAGNTKREANLRTAELRRVAVTTDRRAAYIVTLNLEAALAGKPEQNLRLLPDDELVVRKAPYIPEKTYVVRVSGQVRQPGSYRLYENMTLRDLLNEAGGPIPMKAYLKNAEINRLEIVDGTVRSYAVNIDLEKALEGDPEHNLQLRAEDELIVRTIPDWLEETNRYVTLRGEFRFPGTYPIFKGERLSSVIQRAGGFTEQAYLRAAKFTRKTVQEEQQKRMEEVLKRTEEEIAQKQADLAATAASEEALQATKASLDALMRSLNRLKMARAEGRVVVRLAPLAEFRGTQHDVELMAGDLLEVPQSSNAVSILGEVYNPTTLLSLPGRDVDYYLGRAGGATQEAEDKEIYVIRADGSLFSRQQKTFDGEGENWFASRWFSDPFLAQKLDAGDTIVVPRKLEKIAWLREIKDYTQILANVALAAGVLIAAGL